MLETILSTESIRKSFGAHCVLDGVSLSVRKGEIVGLLGPNGSGKSTLLNILSGFTPSDGGAVNVDGHDVTGLPPHAIARLGLVRTFQLPSMPHRMTVRVVLQAGCRREAGLGGALRRWRYDAEVARLLDQFLLTRVQDQPASALSGGQKKLLSIATALRSRPKLLCLDEPTAGVHPNLRSRMVELLKAVNAQGVTILVVEHDMEFIRELCGRCVVLDRGALIADCTPRELVENPRVVEAYLGKAVEKGKLTA